MLRWARTLAAAIGLLSAPARGAQSSTAQPISVVASVKPNNSPDARGLTEYSPGGRYSATAVTVRSLLRAAYRIQDYQLVGAPAWLSTNRYDIAAKVEGDAPTQQVLLRALLADRFQLQVHDETRELPVFALVPARSGGRLGRQLVKSNFDCVAYAAAPHALPEGGRTPQCATRINPGALSGRSITMTQLATGLAPFVQRFTVDKTGLAGRFDVELTWTPEQVSLDAAASSGPSIFTAIQEQLGLKLIAQKGPVEVLVVDRVAEPAPN